MNLFNNNIQKKSLITNLVELKLVNSSKGLSRTETRFKNKLPINFSFKKLTSFKKNWAGRNHTGQKTLRTRGRMLLKKKILTINYKFRLNCLNFVAGFYFVPFYNKLVSLVVLSTGSITYISTTTNSSLFTLQRFYNYSKTKLNQYFVLKNLNINLPIQQGFFVISQLPKNKPISLIELFPNKGVQYIRSTGSHGIILKMDLRSKRSIIKLPSGVKKFFSTFSICSLNSTALPTNKLFKNKKAGFKKKFGFKSIVRGVAMNPIDHPHGGRTKAIKYPRTPWGKTTKFK